MNDASQLQPIENFIKLDPTRPDPKQTYISLKDSVHDLYSAADVAYRDSLDCYYFSKHWTKC